MGSHQVLPDDGALLGYGGAPVYKEFDGDGAVKWTARFGFDDQARSYRVFKQRWQGRPASKPSLIVKKNGDGDRKFVGYASWNGATDVEDWEVCGGDDERSLMRLGLVSHRGFETRFEVEKRCVQVFALEKGERVGVSDVSCEEETQWRSARKHAREMPEL